MTARHKKKAHSRLASEGAASPASIEARRRERHREIWISFWMSVAITFCLLGVKWLVEQTTLGKQVESMSYDLLQHHLSSGLTAAQLPVVVLDISDIPMVPSAGLQPGLITQREPLEKIVNSLLARQGANAPTAIGLDVDFSPDQHGYADPADEKLFDSFLQESAKNPIPIRVGVNSSLALGPEKWLGNPKYMNLASCVVVPNSENGQSARYIPESIDVKYSTDPYGGLTGHCPSMGLVLAKQSVADVAPVADWFVESVRVKNEGPLSNSEFLVDYSPLDVLSSSSRDIYDRDAEVPVSDGVGGKIVLLGRTKNTTDMFTVPGKPEQAYAGVFLHACAAYTLLQKPLYRLTEAGRILFDILFSGAIFGSVLWSRLSRHKQGKEEFLGHRLPGLLGSSVALILAVGAIFLVRKTHLMWDDFILVAIVLVAHTPIEHATVEIGKWLGEKLRFIKHVSAASPKIHSEGE